MQNAVQFEEDAPRSAADLVVNEADNLLLNIDGYEGPIDVLLDLARNQKVDITKISILQLTRQYLGFIERAQKLNLELAAEYLVMAAWLAYLKSRLLLPRESNDNEPSAAEMAEALQFQLRRLEAMQNAAKQIGELPRLGQQVFARGNPEGLGVRTTVHWDVNLYEMLKAYGDIEKRRTDSRYDLPHYNLMSTEDAITRMTRMLGKLPRMGLNSAWATIESFIPEGIKDKLFGRSALASILTASLELAKQGRLEIRQEGLFRPVYMRAKGETE
ncbi:MAG: segregation/condensation protein A [Alphaproteobacteria bacterium]|jgi:segregation and condensation protein A|nr:segregation/condensation protein A [Alphaproteobacteria bacterium]